jgi:hypothetical protein
VKTSLAVRLALPGALALACVHSAAGAHGATDSSVHLSFAWPRGFETQILNVHDSRASGSDPTGLVARLRLVAEKRGEEVWIFTRDVAIRGSEPDLEATAKVDEALVQVVSSDGTFVRTEGLDAALAVLDSRPGRSGDRESQRRALARSTAFDWELLVGAWAGRTLAPGETRRKQVWAYVPDLIRIEALLDVEYGLEARVPCTEEETARRCVQLSYRARVAPEDRAAVVERMRRELGQARDEPMPEDVHADLEVLVVSEPDTLVPHRMVQRELRRVRVVLPDGRVAESEARSEDTYIFSGRDAPGRARPLPEGGDV